MTTIRTVLMQAIVVLCALRITEWAGEQYSRTAPFQDDAALAPGVTSHQPPLPTALRVQLLESAWATHSIAINDRAVLDRWRVYQYLDRRPDFEALLHVRVREALEYDTSGGAPRSARARIWGPHTARRIDDSHMLFEARVDYAAQGHIERYWMRATPGAARPWSVDSVTLAMFYFY